MILGTIPLPLGTLKILIDLLKFLLHAIQLLLYWSFLELPDHSFLYLEIKISNLQISSISDRLISEKHGAIIQIFDFNSFLSSAIDLLLNSLIGSQDCKFNFEGLLMID